MPRRVQDIKPSDKRSVRHVSLDDASISNRRKLPVNEHEIRTRHMPITPPEYKPAAPKKKKLAWWLIIVIGLVLVVSGAGFLASARFARATFVIVPVSRSVLVNSTFVTDNKPAANNLSYGVVVLKGSTSTSIPASDGPAISLKAQGKITIYNAYSSASQRLVAGTRLAGDAGLVYRLTSTVVVPGYSKQASGNVIPGKVSATIAADQPGEQYNLSGSDAVSDFKIMAYKGSARYDNIYARLASAISGGFVGVKKNVNQLLLASTTANLQAALTASLLAKAEVSVPEGHIFYNGAYAADFETPVISGIDPKTASVSLSGTVYAITFGRNELVSKLSGAEIANSFGQFSFNPIGLENLSFVLTNPKDFTPDGKKPLIVKFKGQLNLVGSPPLDELKRKLSGKPLADTGAVLKAYSPVIDVEHSYGEITPSWIGAVPSDLGRISLIIKTEN